MILLRNNRFLRGGVLLLSALLLLLPASCKRTDGSLKNEGNILSGQFSEQKDDLVELVERTEQAIQTCATLNEELQENDFATQDSTMKAVTDSLLDATETHCLQVNALFEDARRLRLELNRDHQDFNTVYKQTLQNKLADETAKRQIEASRKMLELMTRRITYARKKYHETALAYNEAMRLIAQRSPTLTRLSTYRMPPLKEKITIRQ